VEASALHHPAGQNSIATGKLRPFESSEMCRRFVARAVRPAGQLR
jgi:hypothetical protein